MPLLKVSLNQQLKQKHNQNNFRIFFFFFKGVIKPAAQQGFRRHAYFLHIHLSVQVMMQD